MNQLTVWKMLLLFRTFLSHFVHKQKGENDQSVGSLENVSFILHNVLSHFPQKKVHFYRNLFPYTLF